MVALNLSLTALAHKLMGVMLLRARRQLVANRRVHSGVRSTRIAPTQLAFAFPLGYPRITTVGERAMPGLIHSDPEVMMGKPVIAGTRITVESILERLGAGETVDDLLASHPRLTRDAVNAALRFAAGALRADVVYPTSGEGS